MGRIGVRIVSGWYSAPYSVLYIHTYAGDLKGARDTEREGRSDDVVVRSEGGWAGVYLKGGGGAKIRIPRSMMITSVPVDNDETSDQPGFRT